MAFSLNIKNKEKVNKCVRFPIEIIDEIEQIALENNVSFSKFVIEACEYALKDLKDQKKKTKVKS